MAAIARGADREEPIAASTDFLAKRRVHGVGAAARFDWTRRLNRGTRETTGSVRRSIEAVTEGLELDLQAFTSHPPQVPTAYRNPRSRRRRSAAAASEHPCDHDGRRAPAWLFDDR